MFKSNLNNFMKNIGAKLGANAPGITIGLGTGAIVVSAVMVGVKIILLVRSLFRRSKMVLTIHGTLYSGVSDVRNHPADDTGN